MGNQRAREREAGGPDSGPQTAAKVARALHTRPSTADHAKGPPTGPGNAALARAHAIGALPKLTVSHPDDALEREAEDFSAKVVSRTVARAVDTTASSAEPTAARTVLGHRTDPGRGLSHGPKPAVAHRLATVAREDTPAGPAPETAGPAPDMSGAEIGGGLESFITSASGGSPLAEDLRARIEPVLGADLTDVRVHTDDRAAGAAADLQARAFTYGRNIFLAAGESPADLALMAHEATHVVQQGAVEVYRLFDFIGDAVKEVVAEGARHIPGYTILSQIIGQDPITGESVATGRAEFLQALLGYGPFGGAIGPILSAMDILDELFAMLMGRLADNNLTVDRVLGDLGRAWNEVDFIGNSPATNIEIVTRYVDALIADVRAFVTAIVDDVIAAVKAAAIEFAKPLVERPEIQPYWDLGKKVFHYDPLTGDSVDAPTVEILGDFLRLIGKGDVVEQMTERGTLQETADWLDTQIATFGDLYSQTRALVTDVIDALSPANLPSLITNLESIGGRALSLLQQLRTFAETVITKVLELVKHSLLGMVSGEARKVPGFTLLTVILEKDPFTEEPVERTAENLIKGFIQLLPGGDAMYDQLAESGAIAEAAGKIESEMTRLNISWELITGTFKAIWDGLSLNDLLDPLGAISRIIDQFGEPLGRIIEFAATVIQVIIELILKMMNFPSELIGNIIGNAMAAIDDIKRDPVGFLQNIIEALKQGITGFFDNVGPYLLDGLVDWLFRGLRSIGIEPPESLSVESVITLVIQVVGVTEEMLWTKLSDRIGPEKVQMIRSAIELAGQAFSFIKDVQERGVTAIWEFIQGQLSNLWDTILNMAKDWIMDQIITKVTTKLLSMLDPTGVMAVINSAVAFFNAIQSAIEYITEILQIVDRYVSTIAAIAQGSVGPGAAMLESGLAAAIPIAIGFLANQVGLGDVPEKIRDIILGLRELIDQALDWLFDQAMRLGQAALNALGIGGEGEEPGGPLAIDESVGAGQGAHELKNDGASGGLVMHSEPTPLSAIPDPTIQGYHAQYMTLKASYDTAIAARDTNPRSGYSKIKSDINALIDLIVARLVALGIGDDPGASAPGLGDKAKYDEQTSKITSGPKVWWMESEHVIPFAVGKMIWDAVGLMIPGRGSAVDRGQRTINIYERAADRKTTQHDVGLINQFKSQYEASGLAEEIQTVRIFLTGQGEHEDSDKSDAMSRLRDALATVTSAVRDVQGSAVTATTQSVDWEVDQVEEGKSRKNGERRAETSGVPDSSSIAAAADLQYNDVLAMAAQAAAAAARSMD